ncbi:MAG: hypothetical protein AAFX76_11515, partial [Planctomycetota bacterium]
TRAGGRGSVLDIASIGIKVLIRNLGGKILPHFYIQPSGSLPYSVGTFDQTALDVGFGRRVCGGMT